MYDQVINNACWCHHNFLMKVYFRLFTEQEAHLFFSEPRVSIFSEANVLEWITELFGEYNFPEIFPLANCWVFRNKTCSMVNYIPPKLTKLIKKWTFYIGVFGYYYTSISSIFHISYAKLMSKVCLFSIASAFHSWNGSSLTFIRLIEELFPTVVISTILLVR